MQYLYLFIVTQDVIMHTQLFILAYMILQSSNICITENNLQITVFLVTEALAYNKNQVESLWELYVKVSFFYVSLYSTIMAMQSL